MSILLLESSTLAGGGVSVAAPGVLALHAGLVERPRVVLPQALRHRGRDGQIPVRCVPRRFQMLRGSGLKVTESLAQPRFTELATEGRSLHTNAPLGILEHEPVAMQAKHHAKATADAVYLVPGS